MVNSLSSTIYKTSILFFFYYIIMYFNFNLNCLYFFLCFYCFTIFVDYLVLNTNLFFPIKKKYLFIRSSFLIYIFLSIIFFILFYYYFNIIFIDIITINIDVDSKVINLNISNETNIFIKDESNDYFSISFRYFNSIIGVLCSTFGVIFGILIVKSINGPLLINLMTGFAIMIIYPFLSKFL